MLKNKNKEVKDALVTLNTTPRPTKDGISPNTNIFHISEGPEWVDSIYLGWAYQLNGYEYPTDAGPARYESVSYEQAPRSWASIVVGIFRHPVTDARVAWAWKYYR